MLETDIGQLVKSINLYEGMGRDKVADVKQTICAMAKPGQKFNFQVKKRQIFKMIIGISEITLGTIGASVGSVRSLDIMESGIADFVDGY